VSSAWPPVTTESQPTCEHHEPRPTSARPQKIIDFESWKNSLNVLSILILRMLGGNRRQTERDKILQKLLNVCARARARTHGGILDTPHKSGSHTPPSHIGDTGSIPGQFMWQLWWAVSQLYWLYPVSHHCTIAPYSSITASKAHNTPNQPILSLRFRRRNFVS